MTETKTCRAAGAAGLSLLAFFFLPHAGCGKQAAQGAARTPSPTVVVVVETAERRDVPIMLELAARTEAAATVEVRANVEGRLIEMSFKEGNMVQKGQLLFRIDPRRYEAAVQAAGVEAKCVLANSPLLAPKPVKSKRRTAMPWKVSRSAMRLAARLSLPQVKQWANSA